MSLHLPLMRDYLVRVSMACIGLLAGACATDSTVTPPSGEVVFQTHCAACHGVRGEGDGPVAESIAVPVPNLRQLNARYGGSFPDDAIARYIDGRDLPDAHGERRMPVWGWVFATTEQIVPGAEGPSARIDALLKYLRTLQDP